MDIADTLQQALQYMSIKSSSSPSLNKGDLKLALEAFSLRDSERRSVSLAYAYLASVLLGTGNNDQPESSTKREARQYINLLLGSWLAETSFPELSKAFAALTAILEVDQTTFVDFMQQDGMEDRVIEAGEIVCAEYKIVNPIEHAHVKSSLAAFISQAAAQATILAKKLANPDGTNWLYNRLMDSKEDLAIRVAAAVAFVKFQSISAPPAITTAPQVQTTSALHPTTPILLKVFKEAVEAGIDESADRILQLGLEGLGVATLKPSLRKLVSEDKHLIEQLLQLAALTSRQFSTAVILNNLVTYPRVEDNDDKVKASIRRYASRGGDKEEEAETKEDVEKRCSDLIQASIMPVLVGYSKSSSPAVRKLCGQILLGLVEDVKNRGLVIQQGGAKALLEVIFISSIAKIPEPPMKEDYIAVQALAKLLITSNPLHVLGPTPQSPFLVAAIKPLSAPIISDGSTLLQQFESLMALTNITSLSEELQERLSSIPTFLDKLEAIITESDSSTGGIMCRRAAVELLCNLASSETTFIRYTAIDKETDLKEGALPGSVASRINILLALSDAEDKPTREAALGAMATFTLAPTVARYISMEDARYQRVEQHLLDEGDDEGMQLRAIECLKNVARISESRKGQVKMVLQSASLDKTYSNIASAILGALGDLSG